MQVQFNNGGCSGCLTLIGFMVIVFFILGMCGILQ